MIASILIVLLSACGGGPIEDEAVTSGKAQALGLRSEQPTDAVRADAASADPTEDVSVLKNLSEATRVSITGDGKVSNGLSNAEVVGAMRTLSATASLVLEGVPEVPPPAAPPALPAGGRLFYVDSRAGDDRNDGRAAAVRAAIGGRSFGRSSGPWRSLARLMRSDLGPGDTVVLACGSVWNETLRVPADGTAARPVVVTAPLAGCGSEPRPTIDGSSALPASAWTLHAGRIYKTTLQASPLQVFGASSGQFIEARHPNPAASGSPYLTLAADSPVQNFGTQQRSDTLVGGDDLQWPAGAAAAAAGARLVLRLNDWYIHETTVAGVDGKRVRLAQPTPYPAKAGWGYVMTGQTWMLDMPGEWAYDAVARELRLWMPDSSAPPVGLAVTTLATGIDLQDRRHVNVDGLVVRRAGRGVDIQRSVAVQVRRSLIEDAADECIVVAASESALVEGNLVRRCGTDGIAGETNTAGEAVKLTVRGNIVRDAAVQLVDEAPVTLPRRSRGAIVAGRSAVVEGNFVINSGYIGIRAHRDSRIENNLVFGACSTLDDCAAVYTWASTNVTMRGNLIVRSRGQLHGMPAHQQRTSAQGIYLDESTTGSTVENNTVIDTDHGLHVHVSSNNVIKGNRLFANRISQIWMQATRNRENAQGDLFGNQILDNQVAPVVSGSLGLLLHNVVGSTSSFGHVDGNRYIDRASPTLVLESTPAGARAFSFKTWRTTQVGLPSGRDATGAAISQSAYTSLAVTGPSLVPNGNLAAGITGWSTYNATAPTATLRRESCPPGSCLRVVPGGSSTLVSSPNFSVRAGQWYRLAFDVQTDRDEQPVTVVLRRGGGGSNGFESLSDRSLSFVGGRGWRRVNTVFQATLSVNAADPITRDNGARLDVADLVAGRSLALANMELVPVNLSSQAHWTAAVVNSGGTEADTACPLPAAQQSACNTLMRLDDDAPVAWPLRLPARGSVILYVQDATLADGDRDGIPDFQDQCPITPPGHAVNGAGCGLNP